MRKLLGAALLLVVTPAWADVVANWNQSVVGPPQFGLADDGRFVARDVPLIYDFMHHDHSPIHTRALLSVTSGGLVPGTAVASGERVGQWVDFRVRLLDAGWYFPAGTLLLEGRFHGSMIVDNVSRTAGLHLTGVDWSSTVSYIPHPGAPPAPLQRLAEYTASMALSGIDRRVFIRDGDLTAFAGDSLAGNFSASAVPEPATVTIYAVGLAVLCAAALRRGELPRGPANDPGLGKCFSQMGRALKPGGRLVFSYQHSTGTAWEALAYALACGGFVPIQVFPLLGNSSSGLHNHEGTILWDAVTVCRKQTKPPSTSERFVTEPQIAAATLNAGRWADKLRHCKPVAFRQADHINLLLASLVAASLGTFGSPGRADRRPLLEVLESSNLSDAKGLRKAKQ